MSRNDVDYITRVVLCYSSGQISKVCLKQWIEVRERDEAENKICTCIKAYFLRPPLGGS